MNCPPCGAPNVILHKDIWECGWCGDSGPIPCRIQTAIEQGKTELAEHLYALLQSNPLPPRCVQISDGGTCRYGG